jgi:hypothetical protein
LAQAFMETSENPILGTDQTSQAFKVGLYKFFTAKNALYKDRDMNRVRTQFTDMARTYRSSTQAYSRLKG